MLGKQKIQLEPLLTAQPKMGPNEPCWCQSGRKWKKCHKDRDTLPRSNLFELRANLEETFRKGYCSHPESPDACSGKIIRSHTIQRSGGLSAIAEDGHVMSARGANSNLHKTKGKLAPQKTGIKSASTYNGFCGPHDTSLFRPIEAGVVSLTPNTAFLSLFRAVAYEHFAKRAELAFSDEMRKADAGRSLYEQADWQNYVADWQTGIRVALDEIGTVKGDLDRRFLQEDFGGISAQETTFSGVLPIAVSCAFHPEFDMQGHRLQSLTHLDLEYVTLGTSVRDGRSVVTFAWLGDSKSAGAQLAASFRALAPEDKATALATLCFIHTENWHARPSWWEALTEDQKEGIHRLMRKGMPDPDGERVGTDYRIQAAPVRLEIPVSSEEVLP